MVTGVKEGMEVGMDLKGQRDDGEVRYFACLSVTVPVLIPVGFVRCYHWGELVKHTQVLAIP